MPLGELTTLRGKQIREVYLVKDILAVRVFRTVVHESQDDTCRDASRRHDLEKAIYPEPIPRHRTGSEATRYRFMSQVAHLGGL